MPENMFDASVLIATYLVGKSPVSMEFENSFSYSQSPLLDPILSSLIQSTPLSQIS